MNYLFRYLSTLAPGERVMLEQLDLSRRERDLLDTLLAFEGSMQATKPAALERLAMSGAMFDKTSSIVLRAILAQRVPAGGPALLEHLAARGVNDLFHHELRRQEKELGRNGEAARFWADAFAVLHRRFSSEYPERLARQIAAKLRTHDPSSDMVVYTEACMLGMAVWREAARRTGADETRRIAAALRRNDARITPSTGALARFKQIKAWVAYYGQLEREGEERLRLLGEALALCDSAPEILDARERALTLGQIAEEHYFYSTDLRTPLAMYRRLFDEHSTELAEDSYHTFKLLQLLLVNGEYDDAERVLTERFGREANLEVHGGATSKTVALLWTKLELLRGRLDAARRHLDDAVLLNQKNFYLQAEIECRMLHTALCYLQGDFDAVDRRLATHVKFLRSKGFTYATSRYYPWFFKLVGAFIDERTTGRTLARKLEAKLAEFDEGAAAQYGVILNRLRASSSVA